MQNRNNPIESLRNGLFYNNKTAKFLGFAWDELLLYNIRLNLQGEEKI